MWEFDDILDELKDSGVIRDSEGEDRFEMEMELLSLSMIVQMGLGVTMKFSHFSSGCSC